jgi:hypothetical protein
MDTGAAPRLVNLYMAFPVTISVVSGFDSVALRPVSASDTTFALTVGSGGLSRRAEVAVSDWLALVARESVATPELAVGSFFAGGKSS